MSSFETFLEELMKRHAESQMNGHDIKDNAFTVTVDTNDDYFVTEGGAEKKNSVDCRGYMIMTTNSDECTQFQAQGQVSLMGLMSHLLTRYDAPRLIKSIELAQHMKKFEDK